jgi:hypothetical protein
MSRQKKNEKKSKPAPVIRDQELGQQEQSGVKGGSTNDPVGQYNFRVEIAGVTSSAIANQPATGTEKIKP